MAGSDTNRVRMATVLETTLGVTPGSPRTRAHRFTGEALQYTPAFVSSDEIRDDRMNSDPIKVNETNGGTINGEISYPVPDSPWANFLQSLFFNPWVNTPTRDNDGVADSVITDIGTTANTIVFTTGAAFAVGHLVKTSGFANALNNILARVSTGGATSLVCTGAGYAAETAPPAAARVKVVGLQGASGDLVAAADGITSTSLDFTTMGLALGQWIKIGGTGAAFQFATAACNGWARIVGIAAGKLTLDNLPSGWTTDTGTGKTLRIFFGDQIRNGVTMYSQTIERGWLGQVTPTYIIQAGMVTGQGELTFESSQIAKYTLTFTGMTGLVTTTSLDATPDPVTVNPSMTAAVNVGRIAENGVPVAGPNFVKSMKIAMNNNLRALDAIRGDGLVGAVDIGSGSVDVTVNLDTYFGSSALLAKLFAGTVTNVNTRIAKNSQALIVGIPRLTLTEGQVAAAGKNQDTMLPLVAMASKDTLTGSHILVDRLEYYE